MANSSIKKPCPLGRAFYIYSGGKYANISGRNMITDFIIYSILSDWEITGRVALENNPAVVDTVTTGCFICQMRSCGTIACNIRCQLKAFKGYLRFRIYFFHRSSPLPVIDASRRSRQKFCGKRSWPFSPWRQCHLRAWPAAGHPPCRCFLRFHGRRHS